MCALYIRFSNMVFQEDGMVCSGLRYATNNLLLRLGKLSKLVLLSFYKLEPIYKLELSLTCVLTGNWAPP